MGIVGIGRIGKEVAIRAKAFGMKVIAYDPYSDPKFLVDHNFTQMKTVENLIRQSDIVSLHLNLTAENRHLINAKRLQLFKKDAILLNCSRGELIDTNDIVEALKNGQLGG